MDEKYLNMLEFPKVREIIADFTSFTASRDLALQIQPLSDFKIVTARLEECSEARQLLAVEHDFHIGEIVDIREPASTAARGSILEPLVLSIIGSSLSRIRQLQNQINRVAIDYPILGEIAGRITDLKNLEKQIENCITPAGELHENASVVLSGIRQRMRMQRQHLITRLEGIVNSPGGQRIVQDNLITEREGRYVIPVKIESKKELKGIIHDVSNTGATAFIEPFETIEMGNELRELVNEEKREITRILTELSRAVGGHAGEITGNVTVAAELDLIFAKARYARRYYATEPQIIPFDNGKPVSLQLVQARHPLLGDKAVPLSLEIGNDYRGLVITGPNTGGKTVALKTIGLLSLMALAGLPLPAQEGTCIPLFDNIFVDIGDEQSIEQTLSTFSWHMSNIIFITQNVTSSSLVLLDELGTSTDPAEGSALARAILLYFDTKKAMAVATTHLGDLKAFAYATPGLQNASLDFDPANLTPTYHLTVGIPGGSNAISTAARLGLNQEIISRARGMLSAGAREIENLITNLNAERDKTVLLRKELETSLETISRQQSVLVKQQNDLREKEKRILQETRDLVVSEAADLQREIRQASVALRKQKSHDSVARAREVLADVQSHLKDSVWKVSTPTDTTTDDTVTTGDLVWLTDMDIEARVISVRENTNEVEVQAGPTRIKLSLQGVRKISNKESPPKRSPPVRPAPKYTPQELLLLGKRAEEIEDLLNRYLDDAALSGLDQVRIVHGAGTGVLRKVVRELLTHHPLARAFRPGETGEGGNGVTVVKIRE